MRDEVRISVVEPVGMLHIRLSTAGLCDDFLDDSATEIGESFETASVVGIEPADQFNTNGCLFSSRLQALRHVRPAVFLQHWFEVNRNHWGGTARHQ